MTAEAELHERLHELLDYVGTEWKATAVGCGCVDGCDRPGRYWMVVGDFDSLDRVYDEEGFVHAVIGEHRRWRHTDA
jgi:hypothetical protein